MNGLKKLAIVASLCIPITAAAKVKKARSTAKLNIMLARSPYSIVMLYDKDRQRMRDKEYKEKIKDIEVMFRALSDDDFYKEADLQFIQADVSDRDLASFARKYSVNYQPVFVLFLGRQHVGQPLHGFVYRDQLEQLIQESLTMQLKQRMKEKRQARNIALEKAKIQAYRQMAYWGPYWTPYWQYGYWPYWRGPYFGYGYYW